MTNAGMNQSLRIIFRKLKAHPVYVAAGVVAGPAAIQAYNGLLTHWGAERWLVEFTESEVVRWIVRAFV